MPRYFLILLSLVLLCATTPASAQYSDCFFKDLKDSQNFCSEAAKDEGLSVGQRAFAVRKLGDYHAEITNNAESARNLFTTSLSMLTDDCTIIWDDGEGNEPILDAIESLVYRLGDASDKIARRCAYELGRFYRAREAHFSAIENFTKSIDDGRLVYQSLYYRAMEYYQSDRLERALDDVTKAISIDSSDAAAFNNRGVYYHHLGEREKAIADFRTALALDPGDTIAAQNLDALTKAQASANSAEPEKKEEEDDDEDWELFCLETSESEDEFYECMTMGG